MEVKKYFCDICKKEIETDDDKHGVIPDSIIYNFGSGATLTFNHICKDCGTSIKNHIDTLIKLKGE